MLTNNHIGAHSLRIKTKGSGMLGGASRSRVVKFGFLSHYRRLSTGKSFFLSRPRRFGKSLFTSTLESYFSGKKELFKGLYIYDKENARSEDAWADYPIIAFYLSGGDYNAPDGLKNTLTKTLDHVEKKYGLTHTEYDLANRFSDMIVQLKEKTKRQVVILVDEYDKPLLSTMLTNPEQEEKKQRALQGIFLCLKRCRWGSEVRVFYWCNKVHKGIHLL